MRLENLLRKAVKFQPGENAAVARPIEISDLLKAGPFDPYEAELSTPLGIAGALSESLLIVLTLFMMMGNLGVAALATGEEARSAVMASRMLAIGSDGAWALNPGPIQLIHLSFLIFGKSEFAVRIPSVLFGVLQIACVRGIARRLGGKPARRFAHLALLFTPGWLIMVRSGAGTSAAAALALTGLAMTIHGTTHLAWAGGGETGEFELSRFKPLRNANAPHWLGAGCLWGLATLFAGPDYLWIALPAVAAFAIVPWSEERSMPPLRSWLRPLAGVAAMTSVWAIGPLSARWGGAMVASNGSSPGAGMTASVMMGDFIGSYPMTLGLGLAGACMIAQGERWRRIPDLIALCIGLLALVLIKPSASASIGAMLYPAAAVFIGVGLYEIMHALLARQRMAAAMIVLLAATLGLGAEFQRHESGRHHRGAPSIRPIAGGLALSLTPGEPIAVIDLPAENVDFYLNLKSRRPHRVIELSSEDWTSIQAGDELEKLRGVEFVLGPRGLLGEEQNAAPENWTVRFEDRNWFVLGRTNPAGQAAPR